ncbi:MAG: hypothetical protein R3C56_31595 [Pirellulaceae bacterium]
MPLDRPVSDQVGAERENRSPFEQLVGLIGGQRLLLDQQIG